MFKIQFFNAWRNLIKNKVVSFINITGLTIGFTCAIFAIYYSYHELSYESCHKKADWISRVYTLGKFGPMERVPVTFCPVGTYLQSNYPEIELMARSRGVNGIVFQNNITPISEDDIVLSDPSIFSILSVPFNDGGVPSGPEEIVLSEKMAMKYFKGNAVGKNIIISIYGQKRSFLVTGIFKDFPTNTHVKASFIIPFGLAAQLGWNADKYDGTDYSVYVLTKKGTDIRAFNTKIAKTYKMPIDNIENLAVALVPIKMIHLNANIAENARANLITLLVGGVIALLLSCFNYINLNTILFSTRTKEVGISKTVGAGKFAIFRQFMTDTVLAAFISFGMAILFIALILPSFNSLFDIKIDIIPNLKIISIVVSVFMLTVLLSGFYPALILSGFRPITLIRSNIDNKRGKNNLMSVLITLQFIVAVMLLQFLLITSKQTSHLSKYNVTGFDGNDVLAIDGNAWGDLKKVKNKLLENPNIEAVSWGSRVPGVGMGMTSSWKQEDNQEMALRFWMEGDYLKVFKIRLLEGRTFSEKLPGDDRREVVINKLTANSLGFDDPIGRKMMLNGKQYDIIGLVDNFQAVPPIFADLPLIIDQSGNMNEHLLVRINPKNRIETQKFIRETLSKINPEFPVEMQFYGDYTAELAKSFYTTGILINIFTVIIIFNAMMGLFGLSFFISQRKNKEIGIRKVHGAAVFDIIWKLGKGFVIKLILAFCIASPLIYMGAQKYLSIFPRHIKLGPEIFITGGLIALFVLIISSGFKLLQAANGDPVKTLRYE